MATAQQIEQALLQLEQQLGAINALQGRLTAFLANCDAAGVAHPPCCAIIQTAITNAKQALATQAQPSVALP